MKSISRRVLTALAFAVPVYFVPTVTLRADDTAKVAEKDKAAQKVVVEMTLGGSFGEDPKPENPFGAPKRNFRQQLMLLREIAADPNVVGVKLEVEDVPDFARSIDLLTELRAVKAAGKKIVSYSESMTQRALMFASVADTLAIPPSGQITLEGLVVEAYYLKDMFKMLDVEMKVVHIGEYKTAYEDFAKSEMSAENREVYGHIFDEYWNEMLDSIAANRQIGREAVEAAFDKVYVTANTAKELGLVDLVAYEDEFDAKCDEIFGKDAKMVDDYGAKTSKEELEKAMANPFAAFSMLPKLLNPPKKVLKDEPRIAIVYATGAIASGKSSIGFDGEVSGMGSETIVEALEKALNDEWVKAVVLRVNSPGGSALASDMIWRATQRVKAKKPIVASMGGVAGSGGYWISMGCDRIVAQPSTLTGSIGVVGMLPDLSKLLKRFGVNVQLIGKGPHLEELALMKNGPTPALEARVRDNMLEVYGEFIRKVSEGRKLPKQAVEALAKGRVWTGRQALDAGLVDQLGGLDDAIALARKLAGGMDPKTTSLVEYPEPKTFAESIEDMFGEYTKMSTQVKSVLVELGLESLATQVDVLAHSIRGDSRDRIQAVMPAGIRVR